MADTIRIGILGTGFIAQTRHIPILQDLPDAEITHAWSLSVEETQKVAEKFGIPNVVERWEQIIESPDIDAVVIATPPVLHMPATLAALKAGKHVLCQARMARNLKEARQMLEASKTTDLVTSLYACGFGLKGDRVMRRLINEENYIGDILEVRAVSFYEAVPELGQWIGDPEIWGVNTMLLGILAEVLYRWIDPVTAGHRDQQRRSPVRATDAWRGCESERRRHGQLPSIKPGQEWARQQDNDLRYTR